VADFGAPLEILVDQKNHPAEQGEKEETNGTAPTASCMAVMEAATVKLDTSKTTVLAAPMSRLSSLPPATKDCGCSMKIGGIEDEKPAKEDDLGVEKQPHADLDANPVYLAMHGNPLGSWCGELSPTPRKS
jgi:hypothetical protein